MPKNLFPVDAVTDRVSAPDGDVVHGGEQYGAYVYLIDEGAPQPVSAEILRDIRPNTAPQVHFVDAFDAA